LSSGEYLPGSLQGKISSDDCLKKEQMVVSAIASTPQVQKSLSNVLAFIPPPRNRRRILMLVRRRC
ncbi:hypothetical protein, partial [Shigella dysenteriae]|uniref:hypothetical protein n=1 Tax=Shigella dysenteriae TaxID=622 RepID=UPI0019D459CF